MNSLTRQPVPVDPVIVTTKTALMAAVAESVAVALKRTNRSEAALTPEEAFGWVTNKEAMKLLGLSKPTLARYRANGTLPYSRLGGKVYYRRSALDALLAERAVGAATPSSRQS